MKIWDISQEVFGCCVYPGDPTPKRDVMRQVAKGDSCNLSRLTMCVHNGTHVDAPYHFLDDGKRIDELSLEAFVGKCFVASHAGEVTAEDACGMLQAAAQRCPDAAKRLLIKGPAVVSAEAAQVFAQHHMLLVGNESQTVGPETGPAQVHRILLGAEMVLLEGIRLEKVPDGVYLLNAAPLNLGGCDGAPCRAILMDISE